MTVHDVDGLNAGYASALLEQYLENPDGVPDEWRALFESGASELVATHPGLARLVELLQEDGNGHVATAPPPPPPTPPATPEPSAAPAKAPPAEAPPARDETLFAAVAAAMALVTAYRTHGHLAARLDPLGGEPVGDPALDPARREPKLTAQLQSLIPADILGVHVPGETLADVLPQLNQVYCGTSAYEIEHISDHEQRVWLRTVIESRRYHHTLGADDKRRLLERLTEVEGFERYLRRAFLGQKQFSIEGLDVMVPMLDETIALSAEEGGHEVVLGMAHRGRLNVLAHVLGRPYETILREFEGERTLEAVAADPEGGTGDVKYHLGAEGTRTTPGGRDHRHPGLEPEPPRGGRPRRRGPHPRGADRPLDSHGLRRLVGRDGGPDPRRRGLPGPGRRGRDAQPRRPERLLDGWLAAPDREQPDRLHHRAGRRALDALLERPRQGLRPADHPRQRRRSRGVARGGPAGDGLPPPLLHRRRRSTSSATAATATTSRTRPPTRSR